MGLGIFTDHRMKIRLPAFAQSQVHQSIGRIVGKLERKRKGSAGEIEQFCPKHMISRLQIRHHLRPLGSGKVSIFIAPAFETSICRAVLNETQGIETGGRSDCFGKGNRYAKRNEQTKNKKCSEKSLKTETNKKRRLGRGVDVDYSLSLSLKNTQQFDAYPFLFSLSL